VTVYDSRVLNDVRIVADTGRTPIVSSNQVGWLCALVWPMVGTAIVAGLLLGDHGPVLFWAGVVGGVLMLARQAVKVVGRKVRDANMIIDNAPLGRRKF
jgi:4-hydroxybenzoate polyprenyltransferase